MLQFNRNFPQQGLGNFFDQSETPLRVDPARADGSAQVGLARIEPSAFGVKLLLPVDEYQKTMRSAKYNILFVILTFVAFFFVEILDRRTFTPFSTCWSTSLSAVLCVTAVDFQTHFVRLGVHDQERILTLITFYVRYVFQNRRLMVLFGIVLALLYGFFYSLLQLEDYSLLLGSFGLLLILSALCT